MLFPFLRNRSDKDPNLGFMEKFAYGLGDFASQLVYTPISMLFLYYCTETVNVNIATVAFIMMLSRVFDGFSDLVVGYLVERTNSPYGKSRVWILRMILPFFVCGVAMFSVPSSLPETAKYIYIFLAYNITVTCVYTICNLSYGVLSIQMTNDSYTRSVLVIFRMLSSTAAGTIVMMMTLPMVHYFGNDQMAWTITAAILSALSAVAWLITCYYCHERSNTPPNEGNLKDNLNAIKKILKNRYWVMLSIAMLCVCGADIVSGSVNTYYCKYFLQDDTLIGPFSAASNIAKVFGMIVIVPILIKKIGKRNSLLIATIIITAANLSRFIDPYSVELNYAISAITGFGAGFTYTLLFAMIPDCVEYSEYRDYERHEGLVYSSVSFATKVAAGLGTIIPSLVMDWGGYVNNAPMQTDSAMFSILCANSIISPVMYGIAILALCFYKLDHIYEDIMRELQSRRVKQAATKVATA